MRAERLLRDATGAPAKSGPGPLFDRSLSEAYNPTELSWKGLKTRLSLVSWVEISRHRYSGAVCVRSLKVVSIDDSRREFHRLNTQAGGRVRANSDVCIR